METNDPQRLLAETLDKAGAVTIHLGPDTPETAEEEAARRRAVTLTNIGAERAELEAKYGEGNVWDYKEVGDYFEIIGFMAPCCTAKRKSDGQQGMLTFQHAPRYYFNFRF